MQRMVDELEGYGLEAETAELAEFYASVRRRVEGIDNAEGKQHVVVELYERFFKVAYPKVAESLGIVYTPVEIVEFIIRSVRELLRREFDASLSDEGVHILDPFVGTGTFITRLLQSGFIDRDTLLRKYASELHANEIMLLAYYVAAVNIETANGEIAGEYQPFEGIVLTDTFQASEASDRTDTTFFPEITPGSSGNSVWTSASSLATRPGLGAREVTRTITRTKSIQHSTAGSHAVTLRSRSPRG